MNLNYQVSISTSLTKTRPTFLTKLWNPPLDLQFAPVLFCRSSHVTVTHYLQVICKSFMFDSKTILIPMWQFIFLGNLVSKICRDLYRSHDVFEHPLAGICLQS